MSVRQSKGLLELLPVLCILIVSTASQEYYLNYDNATGLLHFRCPLDSDLMNNKLIVATFGRYNQRTTSRQVSRIANWYNNSATKYESTGNVVLNTRQSGLTGYLTDARCEDSLTYYCSYHFSNSSGRISSHLENFTFTFEGPPSVTIERLQNVHPCPGDKMELKCRAFLGRQTNSIVWESRPPGRQFVLDTDREHSTGVFIGCIDCRYLVLFNVTDVIHVQTPIDTKNCNYYSESTLSRDLTAADHRREWRCRLIYGHAAASIIITMDGSCLKVRNESTTTPPTIASSKSDNSSEYYLNFDNATGLLHFRCPLDSDLKNNKLIVATFGRFNQRTTSGQVSRIAIWYNHSATKYENTGNVVLNTRQSGLTGYLTDVRCEDSLTYYCSYHFSESNGRISTRLENFTFTFEGRPSVTIERLQNVHPCPGDKMELKCRAFLGRQTNSIVWESRPPGGQFVLDTDSNTSHSTPIDTKSCNYYSESTLSRDLTAADHRREWRCRLIYGHAAASIIITMDGSCLKDLYVTTTTSTTNAWPQSEDNTWEKARLFLIVLSLLTIVVVLLFFGIKIIHRKHSNSKSRENTVRDQEIGTKRPHNDEGQTTASNHLELHPSPIRFDNVVGDDWNAKFSKRTA